MTPFEKIPYKPGKSKKFLPKGNLLERLTESLIYSGITAPKEPERVYEEFDPDKAKIINDLATQGRQRGLRGGALINWIAANRYLRSDIKRYLDEIKAREKRNLK